MAHCSPGLGILGLRTLDGANGPAFIAFWESWAHIAQQLWDRMTLMANEQGVVGSASSGYAVM